MLGYLTNHGGPSSTILFYFPHQETPLHWAARARDVDIVRYLVDKGADINIKDDTLGVSEQECTADCKLVLLTQPKATIIV